MMLCTVFGFMCGMVKTAFCALHLATSNGLLNRPIPVLRSRGRTFNAASGADA